MTEESERTGPHPLTVATRSEGNLIVNTRTLVMIGALLLGGTVGGGSISLVTKQQTNAPVTAPEVTIALSDVNAKLAAITVTLAEMKSQLVSSSREDDKRDATLADHEARLRFLEGRGRRTTPPTDP